ncbi:MAG: hypothetical protein ABI612_25755 [Betaproteobacteria bacterium]
MRFLFLLALLTPLNTNAAFWTIQGDLKVAPDLPIPMATGTVSGTFSTDDNGKPITWTIAVSLPDSVPGNGQLFTDTPCVAFSTSPSSCTGEAIPEGFSFAYNPGMFFPSALLAFTASNGVLTSASFESGTRLTYIKLVLDHGTLVSVPIPEPDIYLFAGLGLLGIYVSVKRARRGTKYPTGKTYAQRQDES